MEYSWLKYQYTGLIAVNKEPKKHKIQPGWWCTAAYQIPILFNRYIDTHHVCFCSDPIIIQTHTLETRHHSLIEIFFVQHKCPLPISLPFNPLQSSLYPFYHWIHLCSPVRHFLLCPQPYSHLDRTFFFSLVHLPSGGEGVGWGWRLFIFGFKQVTFINDTYWEAFIGFKVN